MSSRQQPDAADNAAADAVVLVHGLWCKSPVMYYLAWSLRRAGWRCHCLSYASVFGHFDTNAVHLRKKISAIDGQRLHLVAHSYGGLELLYMLDQQAMPRVQRLLLLGSPVRGAVLAQRVMPGRWRRRLLGRAAHSPLVSGLQPAMLQRAAAARSTGVIAGTLNRTLLGRVFGRLQKGDGLVADGETDIPGATEKRMPVSHAGMLLSAPVAAQVVQFLRFGEFNI